MPKICRAFSFRRAAEAVDNRDKALREASAVPPTNMANAASATKQSFRRWEGIMKLLELTIGGLRLIKAAPPRPRIASGTSKVLDTQYHETVASNTMNSVN